MIGGWDGMGEGEWGGEMGWSVLSVLFFLLSYVRVWFFCILWDAYYLLVFYLLYCLDRIVTGTIHGSFS